jgi:hypothetical protein
MSGQGLKSGGTDEMLRRPGTYHLHVDAVLHQQAREFGRFVRRDSAGYAKHDSFQFHSL